MLPRQLSWHGSWNAPHAAKWGGPGFPGGHVLRPRAGARASGSLHNPAWMEETPHLVRGSVLPEVEVAAKGDFCSDLREARPLSADAPRAWDAVSRQSDGRAWPQGDGRRSSRRSVMVDDERHGLWHSGIGA